MRSPFVAFFFLFLLLQLLVTQDGGMNARSRMLAMRAMGDHGTFSLDLYHDRTDDWSRTPDGHYYSNKAPGPILLGFPVFFAIDKIHQVFEHEPATSRGDPGYVQSTVTSFLVQALPFVFVVAFGVVFLSAEGASLSAQLFFVLAALFGNTVAIFMNSYFGHGFEALLQLLALLLLLRRRYILAGLFFSFAMLSDYGFAVQIPALLFLVWQRKMRMQDLGKILLGAIPGAFLWCFYHIVCFGSVLTIASKFQNPVFLDTDVSSTLLFGAVSLPNLHLLYELFFGKTRGIFFLEPWLAFTLCLAPVFYIRNARQKDFGSVLAYGFLGFLGLWLMNASFNGWHGGATPGPRYLSGIFPCLALAAAMLYDKCGSLLRSILWLGLAAALLFRGLVYGSTILAPNSSLWDYYYVEDFVSGRATPLLRLAIYFVGLGVAFLFYYKKQGQKA